MLGEPKNRKRSPDMNRVRGYTLIEILVVITTGAVMVGLAVGLLHMLTRLDQASREQIRSQGTINGLADQFRRDVHAAGGFTVLNAPGGDDPRGAWQFPLAAERVVQYRAEPGRLARIERAGEQVLQQESYTFPAEATVTIELAGDAAPQIVSLRVDADVSQPKTSPGHFVS